MSIEIVRDFFMWCSIINMALLLFSFVMFLACKGWIYKMHSKFFNVSEENLNTAWYSLLGFYKIGVFLFNIVPYIALCILSC